MMNLVKNFWNDQDGAIGVEYMVIVGVIALGMIAVAVALLTAIGDEGSNLGDAMTNITENIRPVEEGDTGTP